MPMYNMIEYSDAYFKGSRSLWQYYWDKPAVKIMATKLIFLLIKIKVIYSILSRKQQSRQKTVAVKIFKQWFH